MTRAPFDFNTAAATALETALNGYLRLDPDFAAALAALDGKLIRVELSGTGLVFWLRPTAAAARVYGRDQDDGGRPLGRADVDVRATPTALLRLTRGEPGAEADVYLQGDVRSARALQRLLADLDIDAETALARLIGELPAAQMGAAARAARDFGRRGVDRFGTDLVEFLQYDRGLLPTRFRAAQFADELSRLDADLDRLETRLRRLAARRAD